MSMKTLDPIIIAGSMAITITRLSRSFAMAISITTMMSMSTVETIFIDIGLTIVSTIPRLSSPLTISVVSVETLYPIVITRSMAIITRCSRPLPIAIVAMKPLHTTIRITSSVAIDWLSLSLDHEADQGEGEECDDGG